MFLNLYPNIIKISSKRKKALCPNKIKKKSNFFLTLLKYHIKEMILYIADFVLTTQRHSDSAPRNTSFSSPVAKVIWHPTQLIVYVLT